MKIRCFILDDEFFSRNIIKDHIAKLSFLEFAGESEDPIEAYALIKENKADLLFLDVSMPNISGVAFLENHHDLPLTIMTTAHPEYALETYKFQVADYLLKPVSFEHFYRAVNKAKGLMENQKGTNEGGDYFFAKTGTKFEKVVFDELLFAEAKDNYIMLHTTQKALMVFMTFKEMEAYLAPKSFVRIHKSYIVNVDSIESIDNDEVKIGTHKLPVSRVYRNDLIEKIQDKILKKL